MGLHAETAPPSLTIIFRLVISGLTSIILVVLGTINLQFQGPFVPISLCPTQNCGGSCPGYSLVIMWLTFPPGIPVPVRQLPGYGSEYYL